MNNYNFSTINDKDFEVLALDLLNEEYNLDLQDFKTGRDKGIDLRFSTIKNDNAIVVQAKHYLKSNFKTLCRNLQKEELDKVVALNPDRYIIVTSQDLSPQNKDEIKSIFHPFIKTSNDIFSSQDLNKLLRKHKEIEKKHFKLWFSSTEIISNILNNAIEGRTRSYLERIKLKIPLYVLTENLNKANKKLAREKILLITGDPGVGKTTLAEVLLFEKAKTKHKIYLINTIREAEDVISTNDKEKQIFYFDDFLGEVYYEIIAGSQKESEIAGFVERIKHTPNKFIILSTRTVILEQARSKSEKIKRSKIETGKYEIVLNSYSNLEKAEILYNHLFFQFLHRKFFETVVEEKLFMWIIKHKNYTPRIIEFITQKERIKSFSKFEFKEFIIKHLTYPEEIWEDSYLNQIEYLDRCLLQTIFTFQRGIEESILRTAYEKRLQFEKRVNNKQISSEQFGLSVKNLFHGFIISSIINVDQKKKQFNFVNPSVSDFLISYFNKNYSIKKATVESIIYLEQFEIFNPEKEKFKFEVELQQIMNLNIQKDKYDSTDKFKQYKFIGYKMEMLLKYCKNINVDSTLLELLKKIDLENIWWIHKSFTYTLNNIDNCPKSFAYIQKEFLNIIESYIKNIDDVDEALKLKSLFKKFGYKFQQYSEEENNQNNLIDLISKITTEREKELMDSYKSDIEEWEDYDSFVYDEVKEIKSSLINTLIPKNISIYIPRHYEKEELEEQIVKNKKERRNASAREANTIDIHNQNINKSTIENKKIEDLFYINDI
ncbi:MAG TPA: hypothetical protein VK169_21045 [Saprospiraceae bacterium]|nr:hypothetical protein [Saprospiraceae bacterium]